MGRDAQCVVALLVSFRSVSFVFSGRILFAFSSCFVFTFPGRVWKVLEIFVPFVTFSERVPSFANRDKLFRAFSAYMLFTDFHICEASK